MQNVAFIINPFSAKKNYQPFLTSLKQKVENPLYIISKSIEDTENFIQKIFIFLKLEIYKIHIFKYLNTILSKSILAYVSLYFRNYKNEFYNIKQNHF